MTGIPSLSDTRAKDFANFGQGLDSGTFAVVWEGFEPVRGDLRVVKDFEN